MITLLYKNLPACLYDIQTPWFPDLWSHYHINVQYAKLRSTLPANHSSLPLTSISLQKYNLLKYFPFLFLHISLVISLFILKKSWLKQQLLQLMYVLYIHQVICIRPIRHHFLLSIELCIFPKTAINKKVAMCYILFTDVSAVSNILPCSQ